MIPRNAVLVANSFVARLFERSSVRQPWIEIQDWWHAEGRMHTGELERTSPGHSLAGRAGLAPHTDIRQRERADFARDLAKGLQHAWATEKWHELDIFASNPFIGELLGHLTSDVQKTVRSTHSLDLTALTAHDIEKRWREEFKI